MKGLRSMPDHGVFHLPHPLHWMHEKHLGLPLLLAGMILLLIIGLQILAGRSVGGGVSGSDVYPLFDPQQWIIP